MDHLKGILKIKLTVTLDLTFCNRRDMEALRCRIAGVFCNNKKNSVTVFYFSLELSYLSNYNPQDLFQAHQQILYRIFLPHLRVYPLNLYPPLRSNKYLFCHSIKGVKL